MGPNNAVPVLRGYVLLLTALPASLIFSPLGAAGTPAAIVAMALLSWWLLSLIVSAPSTGPASPIKWLLLAFVAALLLSYMFGMSRAIASSIEVKSADRALLAVFGWCGLVLVASDGISNRDGLDRVLRAVIGGGALVAVLGVLQFFFNLDLESIIRIPGLVANHPFGEVISRSDFRRVTGTTTHPIEFGVVLSSILPLAIHYARHAASRGAAVFGWFAVGVIGFALPLSVARSGILGSAIALAIMFFTWPPRFRARLSAVLFVSLFAFSAVVPHLIGTIRGLFVHAAGDPSTDGRTSDYAPTFQYFLHTPVFGRGIGTFVPELYRILDNQYLALLVEGGLVGLSCTCILFVGSMVVARRVRRRTGDERTRDLAQSLVAALAVLAINASTFDLFAFSMAAGLFFLLIGCVGALDLMHRPIHWRPPAKVTLRLLSAAAACAAIVMGSALTLIVSSAPVYQTTFEVLLEGPSPVDTPPLNSVGRAAVTATLLSDILEQDQSRAELGALGVPDYDLAVGDGSLMRGTDQREGGSVIHFVTRGPDAEGTQRGMGVVVEYVREQLSRIQSGLGVPRTEWIAAETVSVDAPYAVGVRKSRILAGGLMVSALTFYAAAHLLRRRHRHDSPAHVRAREVVSAS